MLICAISPGWATAQQPDSLAALRRAVTETTPRTMVRVQLRDTRRVDGALAGFSSTGLDLRGAAGSLVHIPYDDVTRYWERRRALRVGMITGGLLGAGTGAFLGALVTAMCEYECNTSLAGGAFFGGLLLGAGGAAAGAIVGAAIPQWHLQWRFESGSRTDAATPVAPDVLSPAAPAVVAESKSRQTGELTLQLVGAYGGSSGNLAAFYPLPEEKGAMFGASASLGFRFKRVAFGPEALVLFGAPGILAVTGLARIDLAGVNARRMPYAVIGIGGYYWQGDRSASDFWLQGSMGVGVALGSGQNWRGEVRWHPVIQNTGNNYDPSLFTLGFGRRFGW